MGGDHAPGPEVQGALRAARTLGIEVILVGRQEALSAELAKHRDSRPASPHCPRQRSRHHGGQRGQGDAHQARQQHSCRHPPRPRWRGPGMSFPPATPAQSWRSPRRCLGMIRWRRTPGAGFAPFPTVKGNPALMVDVGANVDSTAKMLAQFAIMAEIYSRLIFRTRSPACRHPLHRRRGTQRERAHPNHRATPEEPAAQLHRQRRRPRPVHRYTPTSSSATASSAMSL